MEGEFNKEVECSLFLIRSFHNWKAKEPIRRSDNADFKAHCVHIVDSLYN